MEWGEDKPWNSISGSIFRFMGDPRFMELGVQGILGPDLGHLLKPPFARLLFSFSQPLLSLFGKPGQFKARCAQAISLGPKVNTQDLHSSDSRQP